MVSNLAICPLISNSLERKDQHRMEQKAKRLKIVFLSCLDERTLADYSTFNELKLRPRDSEIFLDWKTG